MKTRLFGAIVTVVMILSMVSLQALAGGATYVVKGAPHGLNVRETEGGKVQDVVKEGTVLRVTGESKYWYQVRYDGKMGYVYKDYLKPATYQEYAGEEEAPRKPFVPPTLNDGKYLYRALKDTSIYEKKDKSSREVGLFNAGDTVYVSKTWKYWYQVIVEGERYAYVRSEDFEFLANNLPEVGELKQITSKTEGLREVYVRAEAKSDSKVVKKLTIGTNVRLLSTEGNWAHIVYDSEGNEGYVYKKNLK